MAAAPLHLKGRTAVITGAGSGIGRALAQMAAASGMNVAICDVSGDGLAETARLAESHGRTIVSDVLDVRNTAALADFAAKLEGPVALVFANAGLMRRGPMTTQPIDDLRLMFEVNVLGVAATLQALLPKLKAQTEPSRVVITGSQASFMSFPDLGGYCATKHALFAMAESLSAELKAEASIVGVSFITPGAVATNIFGDAASPNLARSLSPERVAEIVFEGVSRGDYLISTHDDLSDKIGAHLIALQTALG